VACMFLGLLFISKVLQPAEGSGFLLGGVIFGLSFLGLLIYYPIFLIVFVVRWFKKTK